MPKAVKQSPKKKAVKRVKKKKGGSVLDRISSIGFDEDEGINLSLYGKGGTGKTTLWATFPGKILALICSGATAGELRSIDIPEYRKKIDFVNIEKPSEIDEVVELLKDSEYSTVVVDHVTGFQDLVLAEIIGVERLPAQASWGLATQQQYGQCSLQCKNYFRDLLGFQGNTIFIAQERIFNADSEDPFVTPSYGSAVSPSLAGWLNFSSDYIAQTLLRQKTEAKKTKIGGKTIITHKELNGVEYCLRVGAHSSHSVKFRVPKGTEIPEMIVNPSYDKIMELIRG